MRISDWSSDVCSSDLTASDFRTLRFARLADGNARIDGREYTLEPRLRFGSGDDMVSGFIAAYAFRARQNEEIDLFGNGLFRDTTDTRAVRSEEHTSELQSLMRISYAVFCLKKKKKNAHCSTTTTNNT